MQHLRKRKEVAALSKLKVLKAGLAHIAIILMKRLYAGQCRTKIDLTFMKGHFCWLPSSESLFLMKLSNTSFQEILGLREDGREGRRKELVYFLRCLVCQAA